MRTNLAAFLLIALAFPLIAAAAPRDQILAQHADTAKAASSSFSGFSEKRGEALHFGKFTGGKADTPSCTTCHGASPKSVGRTPAGKSIEPVAVSVSPARYSDPGKVEKWFRRNCTEVLGRECTPLEKGDWLTYMISQ